MQYTNKYARNIAQTMTTFNYMFAQAYNLVKRIKEFGDKRSKTAHSKMKQLHNQIVFKPIMINKLSSTERKRAMKGLIFLTKKKNGTIKAKTCANSRTQREYTGHDEAASLTALTKSHLITAVIDFTLVGEDVCK